MPCIFYDKPCIFSGGNFRLFFEPNSNRFFHSPNASSGTYPKTSPYIPIFADFPMGNTTHLPPGNAGFNNENTTLLPFL